MNKGINGWTFPPGTPWADAAKAARDAGFRTIEPTLERKGELTQRTDEATCRKLGDAIRAAGMDVASLATGLFWEMSYTSPDSSLRQAAYELTISGLDRARWLGAQTLLVVPGMVCNLKTNKLQCSYADALTFAFEALQRLSFEAESRNVVIAIENVWNHFLVSPVEMREFIDQVCSPRIGVYFDVGNVLRYGLPQDWIDILGKRIVGVHLKDFQLEVGNINGFCPLGDGDVDWPAVMAALRRSGYDGPLIYEGPGDLGDISRRMDRILALDQRSLLSSACDDS